jgi:hypothetical protein
MVIVITVYKLIFIYQFKFNNLINFTGTVICYNIKFNLYFINYLVSQNQKIFHFTNFNPKNIFYH